MLEQHLDDLPIWATPLLYLAVFFVLLPRQSGTGLREWFNEVRSWRPETHALLWGFFFFVCVVSCIGAFS